LAKRWAQRGLRLLVLQRSALLVAGPKLDSLGKTS
jgi:hypothetical protein